MKLSEFYKLRIAKKKKKSDNLTDSVFDVMKEDIMDVEPYYPLFSAELRGVYG